MTTENTNSPKVSAKKPLTKLLVIGFFVLLMVYAICLGVGNLYFGQHEMEEIPAQPTPTGYQEGVKPLLLVEVPFTVHEIWAIDGTAKMS
ncbi:MAG: hypothetical protein KDJ65_29865 [Anaerolineae bacterium]|nr:hypothetical protein [Anaerolineae bacterium]